MDEDDLGCLSFVVLGIVIGVLLAVAVSLLHWAGYPRG
jgi:hypothetical protein